MGESCWIKPMVERPDGKIVRSKLFDDIYRLTGGNQDLSVSLYNIARSNTFIDAVADVAEFDENGQVTARSFFNLSGRIKDIDNLAKRLNDEYSMSTKSIGEALDAIESFNVEESFSEDYIPLVRTDDKDNISVSIVERTAESVADLEDQLEKNKLTQLIKRRLKNIGVAYDFVGTSKHGGKFSTSNANIMADSLRHLIELSTNQNTNVNDVLVEESAHLATVCMKDSDLIQRLLAALNENTIKDLFSEDEVDSALLNTEDGKLELAGLLVKKSMLNKPLFGYTTFFGRIKNAIYKVFSALHLDDILSDKKKAKLYARQIANRFLYDESELDVDQVEKVDVTLFSQSLSGANKLLNDTLSHINILRNNIEQVSSELWRDLMSKQFSKNKILHGEKIDEISYETAVGFAAEAFVNLTDQLNALTQILDNIDFEQEVNREEIVALYSAQEIYDALDAIKKIYDTFVSSQSEYDSQYTKKITESLNHYSEIVEKGGVARSILEYQRVVTSMVIGELLGKDSYDESARIVLKGFKIRRQKEWGISKEALARQYLYESNDSFINILGDWMRSRMFARDITTQLFDRQIRKLKYNEAKRYRESLAELEVLKDKVKAAGINVKDFYEKFDDGTYTGYFISDFNRHQFEKDKEDAIKKCTVEFLKMKTENGTLDEFNRKTAIAKKIEFDEYLETSDTWNKFVQESYDDYDAKIPKLSKYQNKTYDQLIKSNPQFKQLLDEVKNWLYNLNEKCLTENYKEADELDDVMEGELSDDGEDFSGYKHYVNGLIPQFRKKTVSNIFKNKNKLSDDNSDLYSESNLKQINLDITSAEFGSPLLDTSLNEFNDEISLSNDAIKRIPLYGINKLPDMKELSDDLFGSLALYTQMAWKFHTSQEILPILKVVDNALSKRSDPHGLENSHYKATSNAQRKEMIDKFLLSSSKEKNSLKNVAHKTLGWISTIASIRVLCLSIIPAMKNFFGGLRVPINDAISGRGDMKFSQLIAATMRGINPVHSFGSQFAEAFSGREVEWDRYRNLMRRWDAARNPIIKNIEGTTAIKSAFNYLTNIVMLNYSTTDEQLMHIIYDAHMSSLTLYDAATGKKINLVKDGYNYKEHNRPELKNSIVKSETDIEYWRILNDAYEEVLTTIDENKNAGSDSIRKSAEDLLNIGKVEAAFNTRGLDVSTLNKDSSFKTLKEIADIIKNQLDSICFTEEDEYNYCEKINDYIATSQGLYGALNANELQNDAYAAMVGKLKGWLFGFTQRNLMSGSSVISGGHKQGVLATEFTAACIVTSAILPFLVDEESFKESALNSRDINYQFDNKKFKLYTAMAMFIPFVGTKNKKINSYLRQCGFDPDQLANLSYFIIGRLFNWLIFGLTYLFYRGNYQKVAKANNKYGGNKLLIREGPIFKLFNLINKHEKDPNKKLEAWVQQNYPYSMNQRKTVDGIVYDKKDLPRGKKLNELKSSTIYKVKNTGKIYKIKEDDNGNRIWVETKYGFYKRNTEEWNKRYNALKYTQYEYDTNNPAYFLNSIAYKLGRGVLSEGLSLMDPRQMLLDLTDLTQPIVVTAGIMQAVKQMDRIGKAINGEMDWSDFFRQTANFYMNKVLLDINEEGDIVPLDNYEKQEKADRYRKSQEPAIIKPFMMLQWHINQL